jgi:hypothetical protein
MQPGAAKPFVDLQPADIAALASHSEAGIRPDYLAAVIDNLRVLQDHARIVAAALAGAQASDAAAQAFEP